MTLKKTLESPLDCKEIKPANPKGNQSWLFIERTEAPILWPPDVKSLLTGKNSDAGKDWGWEERGMTEDGMVGWHHWINGHEFEQTLGDSEGQGSLVCSSSWSRRQSGTTEQLNSNDDEYTSLHLSVYGCVHTQCLTLCDPMACSLPVFSVHRILQARILEWVAISFSRGSSWPRDQTCISCIGKWILYQWSTWEAHTCLYTFIQIQRTYITKSEL